MYIAHNIYWRFLYGPALLFFVCIASTQFITKAEAASVLTLRYRHHLFTIDPSQYATWTLGKTVWLFNGQEVVPRPEWRRDGDIVPVLPAGITVEKRTGYNVAEIAKTLEVKINKSLFKEPGTVTIKGEPETGISFEGVGLPGRYINTIALAQLIVYALEHNETDVTIPIIETQPTIYIESEALKARGIKEVVTVGESQFIGSTEARKHNVRTGLSKFNGALLPQGKEISFNAILGKVDGSTGYKKELVILGDKTVPEYGGGLCQVSSTAYRGVWEYGFPILKRRNHSYTVSYYAPQGTDATIYPGSQDMVFLNDGPSDLLIQTYSEGVDAYFIYYGTRDTRTAQVLGPFTWDRTGIPAPKTEYTTSLPVGQKKKLGSPVPGMKAAWFRVLTNDSGTEKIESYYSTYQARPLYYQVGIAAESNDTTEDVSADAEPGIIPEPTWL